VRRQLGTLYSVATFVKCLGVVADSAEGQGESTAEGAKSVGRFDSCPPQFLILEQEIDDQKDVNKHTARRYLHLLARALVKGSNE